MKITLRPYNNDTSRWHVDIRFMNPIDTTQEIRRRMVAPAGLSEAQARSWGEHQVLAIVRELVGDGAATMPAREEVVQARAPSSAAGPTTRSTAERSTAARSVSPSIERAPPRPRRAAARPSAAPTVRPHASAAAPAAAAAAAATNAGARAFGAASPTLAAFYEARFEPEYIALLKPATQVSYSSLYRNHVEPLLGELPLAALDEDRLSLFRAQLGRRLRASTANLVLSHVARLLRFAKKVRAIEAVPEVEKLKEPRKRPKAIYSDAQVERLLEVAAGSGLEALLVCLLALDGGLRANEICALQWKDVDLREGSMVIQHGVYRGVVQTPKGKIGKVALTEALSAALRELRALGQHGPLVLYRCTRRTHLEWEPHTPDSIRHLLNALQERAGLPRSGPHLLRHTALTRLAQLGASVYVVQAVARHARLQTTEGYLHMQQAGLVRDAATLVDRAVRPDFGKALAKLATLAKTPSDGVPARSPARSPN